MSEAGYEFCMKVMGDALCDIARALRCPADGDEILAAATRLRSDLGRLTRERDEARAERDAARNETGMLRSLLARYGDSFFFFKDEGSHWNVIEVYRPKGTTSGDVVDMAFGKTKEQAEDWARRRGANIGHPLYTDPNYTPDLPAEKERP